MPATRSEARDTGGRWGTSIDVVRVRGRVVCGRGSGEATFFQPCSISDGAVFHRGVGATSSGDWGGGQNGVLGGGDATTVGVDDRDRKDGARRRLAGVPGEGVWPLLEDASSST